MEDLDIQNKLRGFDYYTAHNHIGNYLNMLKSTDIETLYLTAGLISEDDCLLNLIRTKLGEGEYHYFNFLLSVILSNDSPGSLRYTYLVRVTKELVKLYKGIKINLFDHGSK